MSLITVGTMAFDAIETPFGKINQIVGGSATYVAYAASHFVKPVQQISIVGFDFPKEEMEEMKKRGVQLEGVEIVPDKKSFFWSGRYHEDMNSRDTLITDLNVLADFDPNIPDSYQGAEFLMLGNLAALLFHGDQVFFAPALPLEEVFDPTGAGDTFAGGFMGHLAATNDISFENMKRGIIVGSAMASFCVEKFGPTRLKEITREDIDIRIHQFKDLVSFDIELI
ncbi:MAG: sugar kinase [Chitinophagaceae bacterium]|nr:sugar kinase [Chitinophagaceae bacterium]